MNNKGFAFFVLMMIAIVFIVMALAFAPPLREFADTAMNASTDSSVGLNCTSPTLNKYDRANCLFVDYQMPFFVGFLIFAAGAIITARLIT